MAGMPSAHFACKKLSKTAPFSLFTFEIMLFFRLSYIIKIANATPKKIPTAKPPAKRAVIDVPVIQPYMIMVILGGIKIAVSALETISPRLNFSLKPAFFKSGYISLPIAATVAAAEPDTEPKAIALPIVVWPRPPVKCPKHALIKLVNLLAISPEDIISAAIIKKGIASKVEWLIPPTIFWIITVSGILEKNISFTIRAGTPRTINISKPNTKSINAKMTTKNKILYEQNT